MKKKIWGAILAALLLVTGTRDVLACGEAVFEDSKAIALLKEAEDALEQGDVLHARTLAAEVERDSNTPVVRTARISALSYVRDRNASHEEIETATARLGDLARKYEESGLTQSWGEAMARAGNTKQAYDTLQKHERNDVIVSAWTHAAMGRVARSVGDHDLALTALTRCETTATNPKICRGEYPPAPLLRGKPTTYAFPGAAFLLAFLCARGRRFAPWRTFQPRLFAGVAALGALVTFLLPRPPALGIAAALLAVVAVLVLQPRLFMRAVRRGKVPGMIVRPATAEDGALPLTAFLLGPAANETLEHTIDSPTYRTNARNAFLRVGRRLSGRKRVALVCAFGVAASASAFLLFLAGVAGELATVIAHF